MPKNVESTNKENVEEIESAIMKDESVNFSKRVSKRKQIHDEPLRAYGNLLDLRKSVSTTRLNRINAASRLLQTERFLQGINIYYSCFSAILAILSILSDRKELAVQRLLQQFTAHLIWRNRERRNFSVAVMLENLCNTE